MTEPTLIDFLEARLDEREKSAKWIADSGEREFVLVDVKAKRQIIEEHSAKDRHPTECKTCTWNDPWEGFFSLDMPCPTLRLLALPFASHPDYRPEWAPEVQS